MDEPVAGQRFIATKRVKGQRFRQTVFTNREKKSGTLTVASGTVLTFIGIEKGAFRERWRFTADKLAGVEVRIPAEDARRALKSVDAPHGQEPATGVATGGTGASSRQAEAGAAAPGPGIGVAEELQRFAALRDSGALTEEEFQEQKTRLLAGGPMVANSKVDVYLVRTGDQPILVVKALRELTGVGLAEAKQTIDSVPQLVLRGVSKDEADRAARLFDETSAALRIQPAGSAFSGELGHASKPSPPSKPWYLRPSTYVKLFLGWLLLFGLASCINWLREEPEGGTPAATQPAQPARPAPAPAPAPAPRPTAPTGQGLQRILDGLVVGAAELADFVMTYE